MSSATNSKKIAQYQLGNLIGKGGFGSVYRALDPVTARFVAIKQVSSGSLMELKMEIALLSKLKHRNIVKYIDSIKQENQLNIVLEYVEGGSLASILKKFGAFSESLCAIYTRQILIGLQYLHLQGVIHRDIKGANVLTTKNGLVKLADFGVAMKLNDPKQTNGRRGAVGTPFWMAPEIIESVTNPTPACDIWSVGSTVIEMATEKAPYHDLDPVAAMYRIVADPHPEMPEGISVYLENFLKACFEKNPLKRPSATDLLTDEWIERFLKINRDMSNKSLLSPSEGRGRDEDEDDAIDEETETLAKFASRLYDMNEIEGAEQEKARTAVKSQGKRKSIIFSEHLSDVKDVESREVGANSNIRGRRFPATETVTSEVGQVEEADAPETMQSGTSISPSKWMSGTQGAQSPKTNESTSRIRFGFLEHFGRLFETTRAPDNQNLEVNGNYDKTLGTDLEQEAPMTEQDSVKEDIKRASIKRPDTRLPPAALRSGEDSPLQPLTERNPADAGFHRKEQREAEEIKKLLSSIRPFEEPHVLVHTCKKLMELFQPKRKGGISGGKGNLDNFIQHGAVPIVEMLQVTDHTLLHTVLNVVNRIIEGNQSFQDNFAMSGLIPAVLKFARPHHSRTLRLEAACFVSSLCNSSDSCKMLVACGGLEALVDLVSHDYYHNRDLVWQALDAMGTVFTSASDQSQKSDFCRILAKHGLCIHLTVLIDTLACDIHERASEYLKVVVDLLLLFAREGDTVVKIYMCTGQVLEGLIASLEFLPPELTVQICRTFKRLAHEPDVLNMLENAGVVPVLVHFLAIHCKHKQPPREEEDLVQNFTTRTASQAHDACWQCMLALYFLCKLSRARQEQAALAGALPVLQELVEIRIDLRRYAFEMISWMTGASLASRKQLWDKGGVAFFVRSLEFTDLQQLALEALVDWLRVKEHRADWCQRVEGVLLQETSFMGKILALFKTPKADAAVFVKILDPLLKLLRVSNGIKEALAGHDEFFQELVNRLKVQRKSNATFLSQTSVIVETEPLAEVAIQSGNLTSFSLNTPAPPSNVRRLVSESAVDAGVDVRVRMDLLRLLLLLCDYQSEHDRAAFCARHQLQHLMRDVISEEHKKHNVLPVEIAQQVLELFKDM